MKSQGLLYLLFAFSISIVDCNLEGDVLNAWKATLRDPNNVLQSWDPTLVNPCTWFHVTCNGDNSVVRVDLGNGGLSGPLIPQLGLLSNLQYLEVFENRISGSIPWELGNLTKLISLDLYQNSITGSIPPTLGNLRSLRFLRLNSNKLSGKIPIQVLKLVYQGNLSLLNVSDNQLTGTGKHHSNATGLAITTIIQDAKA